MSNDVTTRSVFEGQSFVFGQTFPSIIQQRQESTYTAGGPYNEAGAALLSDRPLRPPRRPSWKELSNAELKRLAEKHPPPASWYEGDEECPF